MKTMKAVRIHAYGGLEALAYEDAPIPTPGPGGVLVKVHAAGVNPVDWKIRAGYLQQYIPHTFPLIPGWEFSGEVEAVGEGVTAFRAGDGVLALAPLTHNGAYAEYVVVDQGLLAPKPKGLDHAKAAALPLAGLTAWNALFEYGELKAGQTVLIHGGAGGVGVYAIQLAKGKGARVIATASGRNQGLLKELGADVAIDYAATPFENVARDVDLVLDTQGGEVLERSWQVLKRGGILASLVAAPPSEEKAKAFGVRARYAGNRPNTPVLRELADLMAAGKLHALVETLPLQEARRAQEAIQGNHTRGKLVLKVG